MTYGSHLLFGAIAAAGVLLTLVSMAALAWVVRPRARRSDVTPPVTILKPLKGVDEALEANLRSFFQLDYPAYQLLFGVVDPADPAVGLVERLLREHPDHDARLVIGRPGFGLNPKVENLAGMLPYRRHDTILISDSNVRVEPSYLRETAAYLAEPGVGLVSNLIAGEGEVHLGAALENLQLNGFIAGGVALAAVTGSTCVVGKSMLMPVRVLEEIGGLWSVRNFLAEDQILGLKVRDAGYQVRLSHHVVRNINQARNFAWFLNRHSRWYKLRRRLALPLFLLEPMTNLGVVGLLWFLADDTGAGCYALPLLWGVGMARDAVQSRWLRGSFPSLRHLLLSPVKDLFLLPLWIDALVNDRIQWRGNRRRIGRFTRLRRTRLGPGARRRARRLRARREPLATPPGPPRPRDPDQATGAC